MIFFLRLWNPKCRLPGRQWFRLSRECEQDKVGKHCQAWNTQKPHKHSYGGVGNNNHCRNLGDSTTTWCYTTDPGTRWEPCDVKTCTPCYENTVGGKAPTMFSLAMCCAGRHFLRDFLWVCILYEIFLVRKFMFL